MEGEKSMRDITNKLKSYFRKIEDTNEFKNIVEDISPIFYTLYIRCKRTYHTILSIKESQDKNVTHIEALPSFRVLLESYFHLSYVMDEKDTSKIRNGYESLADYSHRRIARKMKHFTGLLNDPESDYFVSLYQEDVKLPKEYEFLDDVGLLAGKTNKRDLYRKHYSILNSFIHFNPSIFKNYGSFKDGIFIFNAPSDDPGEGIYILINNLVLAMVIEIAIFLNNQELEETFDIFFEDYLKEIRNIKHP
jgi:Family of unknown function (DUF5677)